MPVIEESVTISGEKELPAFQARPSEEGLHPAVIIVLEIFGLNDHIRSVVRRLAESGYVALAPDFFRHEPTPYDDFAGAREVASCLSDVGAMEDVGAALDYLEKQPFVTAGKTGILGFCMGGRLAFLAACHHPDRTRACVDFYGARMSGGGVHGGHTMVPLEAAPALACPVQFFYGADDHFIPPEEVERVRERMTSLGKSFDIQVYEGAGHGFFCDQRESYQSEAATDAWSRTLKFLHEQLGEESVV
ncbi:MAG: dienelactone hydrolase family protein [Armatimonadota bacterium]|nr:dienelactone hydrolase family protein [Armatimonadota bacterium]